MAANVEPEEVEALLEDSGEPITATCPVETRDFGEPRRLSTAVVDELRRVVEASLPTAEMELSRLLHGRLRLELGAAHEVNAQSILNAIQEPMALVRFNAGGHPAWAQWEIESATMAVEQLLGAPEPVPASRELSSLERTILRTLIEGACRAIGTGLGLELTEFQAVAQRKQAGHWREVDNADPHRLGIELHLETPAGQSSLRIYLPIFEAQLASLPREGERSVPGALPRHLCPVELDVSAALGQAHLPLSELLAIEVGDVLKLDARRGQPARVIAAGHEIGDAELGSRRGVLALKVERWKADALHLGTPEGGAPQTPAQR